MKYAFDLHHRRSIRLKGYDYSRPGAYFITICTQNRLCLFGQVVDGNMMLNDAGQMIQNTWDEIPRHYHGVDVDAFIVMPNHIHGVVIIVGATPCGCPDCSTGGIDGLSLPDVVHRFKTLTTKRYIDGVKHHGWTPFPGKLWQRNYYEHIVRDKNELNRIREYINNNPLNWAMDQENPNLRTTSRLPQG